MTTYAAGLRVSEVVNLMLKDIDSRRMTIRVCQGKGNKDRYTILSNRLVTELRTYWRKYKPRLWLFPGAFPDRPMTRFSAERLYYAAKERAGITKEGCIHMLRHYAAFRIMPSYDCDHGGSLTASFVLLGIIYMLLRKAKRWSSG
jgi:integrase